MKSEQDKMQEGVERQKEKTKNIENNLLGVKYCRQNQFCFLYSTVYK